MERQKTHMKAINYYLTIQTNEMDSIGDVIAIDWDRDMDGTPAQNLTQSKMYCPFILNDNYKEITEADAKRITNSN